MKSQIAGICATINEKIDEAEKELDAIKSQQDAAWNNAVDANDFYEAKAVETREQLVKLRTTVSTLQDL